MKPRIEGNYECGEIQVKGKGFILTTLILLVFSLILFSQERVFSEYKIGPKDVLEIRVVGLEEFNDFKARVEEDGTITLPLLDVVDVNGLSKTGVERKLKELLGQEFMQDPQVTVFISEYGSNQVYLNGAVTNPGQYPLVGRQTLMMILSQAGGLTPDAGDKIIVYRNNSDGTSTSITISVDDLYLNGDASLNIPLQVNDTINVPPGTTRDVEFVAWNPGVWRIHCHKLHHTMNAHAEVPLGVMGHGGMFTLLSVEPE